jgi:hypothetical protein
MTLPNEQVKQVLKDISRERLEFFPAGYVHKRDVNYDEFAQQVVGKTITAVLTADLRDIILTSYDADIAAAVTSRIIDNIRKHWSFM